MVSSKHALLLALGLDLACGGRSSDPIILSLGDQSVRRSEFERHVKLVEARGGGALDPAVRDALIEPFLEERVVILEARSRGLLRPDSTAEEEENAVRRLLADSALGALEVAEEDVARYYGGHAAEMGVPETVTLRQILVATENEARDVRRRLQKDPKNFETLARSRSRAPEASTGGLMGVFSRGQLPAELEAAAFALPPGASDIIATPLGYHVLRVDNREAARERSLEECRDRIRILLHRQRSDQSVRQFVRGLLARAKVNHEAAKAVPSDS